MKDIQLQHISDHGYSIEYLPPLQFGGDQVSRNSIYGGVEYAAVHHCQQHMHDLATTMPYTYILALNLQPRMLPQ